MKGRLYIDEEYWAIFVMSEKENKWKISSVWCQRISGSEMIVVIIVSGVCSRIGVVLSSLLLFLLLAMMLLSSINASMVLVSSVVVCIFGFYFRWLVVCLCVW